VFIVTIARVCVTVMASCVHQNFVAGDLCFGHFYVSLLWVCARFLFPQYARRASIATLILRGGQLFMAIRACPALQFPLHIPTRLLQVLHWIVFVIRAQNIFYCISKAKIQMFGYLDYLYSA
jgi:hypothetical protein